LQDLESALGPLLEREDETREWKENGADPESLIETLCAFANDLGQAGGGSLVCGVAEEKDAQGMSRAKVVGLKPEYFTKLVKGLLPACHDKTSPPVTPSIRALEDRSGKKAIVFGVKASPYAHQFKPSGKPPYYPIRVGAHTKRANGEIPRLLELKQAHPPYLSQVHPDASAADVDALLAERYLDPLSLPKPTASYLEADTPLPWGIPSLLVSREENGTAGAAMPRNFALLLFNREPHRFLPGAYAIFSVYHGTDKTAGRSEIANLYGPLPALFQDVMARLKGFMGYIANKQEVSSTNRVNTPFYPEKAVWEAVANAFLHRDYRQQEPVRITVFSDHLEIVSPGGLPGEVTEVDFRHGEANPYWRNSALAHLMEKLGYAQYQGQGLPTIIREVRSLTGNPPDLKAAPSYVAIRIPATRPNAMLAAASQGNGHKPGLALISFGAPPIADQVQASLHGLGLAGAPIALDFVREAYLQIDSDEWRQGIADLKKSLRSLLASADFKELHLFFRGPLSIAVMIGAMIGPSRKCFVYNFHSDLGEYRLDLVLDAKFLRT